jgi:hypothetical protein
MFCSRALCEDVKREMIFQDLESRFGQDLIRIGLKIQMNLVMTCLLVTIPSETLRQEELSGTIVLICLTYDHRTDRQERIR